MCSLADYRATGLHTLKYMAYQRQIKPGAKIYFYPIAGVEAAPKIFICW